MKQDIDFILAGWEYKPEKARSAPRAGPRWPAGDPVARGPGRFADRNGRFVPDARQAARGIETYFDYLEEQVAWQPRPNAASPSATSNVRRPDREFLQYYHRRMCWLALRQYARAIRDADHTLAFLDLVKRHAPSDEYSGTATSTISGFVLFSAADPGCGERCRWRTMPSSRAVHEIHDRDSNVECVTSSRSTSVKSENGAGRHGAAPEAGGILAPAAVPDRGDTSR